MAIKTMRSKGLTCCQNGKVFGTFGASVSGRKGGCGFLRKTETSKFFVKAVASLERAISTKETAKRAQITVSVPLRVNYGEHLRLVGSSDLLGAWSIEEAPKMKWTEGDVWMTTLEVPLGFESEFKFVHCMPDQVVWEYTPNRTLRVSSNIDRKMLKPTITVDWCHATEGVVEVGEGQYSQEGSHFQGAAEGQLQVATNTLEREGTGSEECEKVIEDALSVDKSLENVAVLADEAEKSQRVSEEVPDGKLETVFEETSSDAVEDSSLVAKESKNALGEAAKKAGYVAAGVAGAALLSTFAVDLVDTAVLGAFAVAAGGAAFSGKSSGSGSKEEGADTAEATANGEEDGEEERKVSTEPGTIVAAGVLSAIEAGKEVLSNGKSAQTASEEENSS